MPVMIGAVGSIFMISRIFATNVLCVEEEDFDNNELTTEGLMNSIALFFVSNSFLP